MIKTDELYLENLSEFVYDDKKVVTYKFLSVFLGVHVNLAKQMLYTFYERETKNGKKLHGLYYLSGLASEKINLKHEDASSSQGDDLHDRHVVLLCRDYDLEDVKKRFSKLFSVHIYCLSAHPINDYSVLQPTVDKPVQDDEGRTPADFGPFSCNAEVRPEKLKPSTSASAAATLPKDTSENVSKGTDTKKTTESPKPASSSSSSSKTPTKGKNFFGTQSSSSSDKKSGGKKNVMSQQSSIKSSFSKTKVVPKSEKNVHSDADKMTEKADNSKVVPSVKKKQVTKSTSKARKRIRVDSGSDSDDGHSSKKRISVFTSSDDDDDDSREGSPNSKSNSSRRIESDTESEEEPAQPIPDPSEANTASADVIQDTRNGRKRVVKTITKTFVDDDGYVVTQKVQEVVSDVEDGSQESAMDVDQEKEKIKNGIRQDGKTKPAEEVTKPEQKQPSTSSVAAEKSSGSSRNASSTKAKSTTSSQSKTKQASIMSFFQKK